MSAFIAGSILGLFIGVGFGGLIVGIFAAGKQHDAYLEGRMDQRLDEIIDPSPFNA
jgi:hypothetical protein